MANQPLKKKEVKKNSFSEFKKNNGYTYNNADKEMEWIIMPPGFQEATRLPGFPIGFVSSILGHSNVGKSTLMNHALAQAQRQGIIPVIIDTENAFDFTYAKSIGFQAEPIYDTVEEEIIDYETGEVKKVTTEKIVSYDGDFLYFNNAILAERYGNIDYASGKTTKTKRKIAVIEDVAQCINDLLDAQDNGDVNASFLIIWDSVGSIGSFQEFSSGKKANNLWQAGAIATSMQSIINDRIPRSRKITSEFTNTLIIIQKLSVSMTPMGLPSAKGRGGYALQYATRLQLFLGSVSSAGIKTLSAVSKGVTFNYAIESKIKVTKTHLPSPYDTTSEGKYICTSRGIIRPSDVDEYRKEYLGDIIKGLNKLLESKGESCVDANDIEFIETSEDE